MELCKRLKKAVQGKETLVLPGCFDCTSAILASKMGFKGIFVSGYSVAASTLGMPDRGLITMTEMINTCKNIISTINIPVVVDIDTGYGSTINAKRSIKELKGIGASGFIIEDQTFPKRCGHHEGKELEDLDKHLEKLREIVKEKGDMVIFARTDAEKIDEILKRAEEFSKLDVDCILVDGIDNIQNMKTIRNAVDKPLAVNLLYGGKTPIMSNKELADIGFDVIIFSTVCINATSKALYETLSRLYTKGDLKHTHPHSFDIKEFESLLGFG
ncbi:isocitrate lyase/PEP mutase family protein [Candidatus Woesearchaeota archaeon]|nr:isocitrate lyase/PEP mutase family protein [Candidatus Woesearchaeota archaeon]